LASHRGKLLSKLYKRDVATDRQTLSKAVNIMESQYEPPPGSPPDFLKSSEDEAHIQLWRVIEEVKDYQLTHGNQIKVAYQNSATRVPSIGTGVSVIPTRFPRRCYEKAVKIGPLMNELYIRAACTDAWLGEIFKPLLDDDPLLSALWDVHQTVKKAGVVQEVVCGIFRSDYMAHQTSEGSELKQVEMNNTCIAGTCHASIVASMHRHFYKVKGLPLDRLPGSNDNIPNTISTLSQAHKIYTATSASNLQNCVVMIVQDFNFNVADERPIEYGLWDANIPCYRCIWEEVLDRATLTDDRRLLFQPPFSDQELEVSVIYYRAGFEPREYDERGKQTRLQLELSGAIKAPDILAHLTTLKAVQQALTEPGVVAKLLPNASAVEIEDLTSTFMPMHKLSPINPEIHHIATSQELSASYVLKPNLEGGGHNIYRSDIPVHLSRVPPDSWEHCILMRLIEPPKNVQGLLLTNEEVYEGDVVSELGIVGTSIWRRRPKGKGEVGEVEIVRNDVAGWTFKTKPAAKDEMSVVKGYGCFDCPELVDD
jgi:glutathione synthase